MVSGSTGQKFIEGSGKGLRSAVDQERLKKKNTVFPCGNNLIFLVWVIPNASTGTIQL